MSEHSSRTLHLVIFAVLLLVIPSLNIISCASGQLNGAPDLSITELKISPTRDGYQGTLRIKNLGMSSNSDVGVVVLDLEDGSRPNRSIVVTFPLVPLSPGHEFIKEFKWVPERPGTHLIVAVVDTDGVEREVSESNNVRSLMVSLPFIGRVSSDQDGNPDPEVFGEYIAGIENAVDLDIFFQDVEDPSLIRVYATIEGQFMEYGTRVSGTHFRASFDTGSLPQGNHTLNINSTYGGQPLPRMSYTVRISPVPPWFGELEKRYSYFDRDLSSYVLTGKLDVSTCSVKTLSNRMNGVGEVVLNDDREEIFLSAYILLDGTTTIISRGDTPIEGGSNTSYRTTVPQEGKAFLPSAHGNFTFGMDGSTAMSMELSVLTLGRKLHGTGAYQDPIELPLPEILMEGYAEASTFLSVGEDGHFGPIISTLDIKISGNTTDIVTLCLPGYDDPRLAGDISASWTCSMEGTGPHWSGSAELSFEDSLFLNDLGLRTGNAPVRWDLDLQGMGTDTAAAPSGNIGQLELTVRDGHTTHLVYRDGTIESEIYRNNTYKSHPDLEYLGDGRPVVVWSEAGYMEDMAARSTSMRLYYHIGDIHGNFNGSPSRVTQDGGSEQHPCLATDQENQRSAIAFIKDIDENATTMEDREVMVTFLEGDTWTIPERITEDGAVDRDPDLWFDDKGNLHIAWLSGVGEAMYSVRSESDGWSKTVKIVTEEDQLIEEVSFVDGMGSTPYLLLVVSVTGAPYRLMVAAPDSPMEEAVEVASSRQFISSSRVTVSPEGGHDALWRAWNRMGGDLYVSTNPSGMHSDDWTEPLRLTLGSSLELSPTMMRRNDSTFDLGFIEVPESEGDLSSPTSPTFTVRDLSWGGEVTSLSVSDPDATPGTMVSVIATVSYRGMTPSGMVRADLYRVIRDRETGGLSQEFWDSEVLNFHDLGQTLQVEFTVSVKEFQLGFSVVTVPTLSGIPAHTSQKFSSLPALPDLEILDVEPVVIDPSSPTTNVKVSIRNWGTVPAGTRTVKVFGSETSAPLAFQNRSMEPLFLRSRSFSEELNLTVLDIGAGSTVHVEMNITLSPGVNHIWSVVEGPSWLPFSESQEYIVLDSMPLLDLSCQGAPAAIPEGGDITVEARIQNIGPWPLNISYPRFPWDMHEGLSERRPVYTLVHAITHNGSVEEGTILLPVDELNIGEEAFLNWSYSNVTGRGRQDISIRLTASSNHIPARDLFLHFLATVETHVSVEIMEQAMVGDRYSRALEVKVHNPNPSRIEVIHLSLYNGQKADGIVVSEEIAMGLLPGETRIVKMNLPLEKGLYVLTATAEVLTLLPGGNLGCWHETDATTSDVPVMETSPVETTPEEELDMEEVTTAGIITFFVIVGVLGISSLFYRREQKEKEDE
ncbi:MAG: hypothetical protein JW939_01465 [Candidatus Thermoplasmatota archaeon]|nr:hypothetical protein [Candidatus Thermoplasmatota archaeon]